MFWWIDEAQAALRVRRSGIHLSDGRIHCRPLSRISVANRTPVTSCPGPGATGARIPGSSQLPIGFGPSSGSRLGFAHPAALVHVIVIAYDSLHYVGRRFEHASSTSSTPSPPIFTPIDSLGTETASATSRPPGVRGQAVQRPRRSIPPPAVHTTTLFTVQNHPPRPQPDRMTMPKVV